MEDPRFEPRTYSLHCAVPHSLGGCRITPVRMLVVAVLTVITAGTSTHTSSHPECLMGWSPWSQGSSGPVVSISSHSSDAVLGGSRSVLLSTKGQVTPAQLTGPPIVTRVLLGDGEWTGEGPQG